MFSGERLKEARKRAGMSQQALAEASDMSREQIKNYEHERNIPWANNLCRIASVLNVSLDWLCKMKEE